jgi:hypothetical protein
MPPQRHIASSLSRARERVISQNLTIVAMPHLLDVEVTLLVDGKPLPEYKIEVKGEHEIACYVPSETGKVRLFQVVFSLLRTENY